MLGFFQSEAMLIGISERKRVALVLNPSISLPGKGEKEGAR